MSGKDLFEGMSHVDERFVDEAETQTIPKRIVSPWLKAVSMAACLCLIVFSIYNLNRYWNRGATEGLAAAGAADQISPGGGMGSDLESEIQQETQQSVIAAPGSGPSGEAHTVILRVDEMTDAGFKGTVAELTEPGIFDIGMELNVVVTEGTRHETAGGNPPVSADFQADYSGSYVRVQFIDYNKDTGTILVNAIHEVVPREDTPKKG